VRTDPRRAGPLDRVLFESPRADATELAGFREEVLAGLRATRKRISPKFLYDARGSWLFEQICTLPEYYAARAETSILQSCAGEVAALAGPSCCVVELGSGACRKVRLLLDWVRPASYLGMDISRETLGRSARRLARDYPWLEVRGACVDLSGPLEIAGLPAAAGRRLALFFGSSIGNFEPDEARALLRRVHGLVAPDGALLIGVDLRKDPRRLHAAYNDAAGVTARFNLNLLARLRRELGATVDTDGFAHQAFYDEAAGRVEMHLASRRTQALTIDGHSFAMAAGETIHTENSYKYTVAGFTALAGAAGFEVRRIWTDPERLFSVHYLQAA
jgi:dimethylhistidine N-methyltransferase